MTKDDKTDSGNERSGENEEERWPDVSEERRERYRRIEEEHGLGLIQMWWGDGKGKTTSALGMSIRAAGHGFDVFVLQFMKGKAPGHGADDEPGEISILEQIDNVRVERSGEYGWVGRGSGSPEWESHEEAAKKALERVRGDLDGTYDMVVLDEALYAVSKGLFSGEELIDVVESRSEGVEVVLTGGHERLPEIEDVADLVTHVKKVKHPFDKGIPARRGTEY